MNTYLAFNQIAYVNEPLIWECTRRNKLELTFLLKSGQPLTERDKVINHLTRTGYDREFGMVIDYKAKTVTIPEASFILFSLSPRTVNIKQSQETVQSPVNEKPTTQEKRKSSTDRFRTFRPSRAKKSVSLEKLPQNTSDSTFFSSSPLKTRSSATDSPITEPKVIRKPYTSIRLTDLITPIDATLWRRTLGLNDFTKPRESSAAKVSEHLLSLSAFRNNDHLVETMVLYPTLQELTGHLSDLFSHVLQPVYHVWRKDKQETVRKELVGYLKFAINNLVDSNLSSVRTQWEQNPVEGLGEFFENEARKNYIIGQMAQVQAEQLLLDLNFLFDKYMDEKLIEITPLQFEYSDIANLHFYSTQKSIQKWATLIESFNELVEILRSHDATLEKAIQDRYQRGEEDASQGTVEIDWSRLSTVNVFLRSRVRAFAIKSFKELLLGELDAQPDHKTQLNNVFQGTKKFILVRQDITKKKTELLYKLAYQQQDKIGNFYSLSKGLVEYLEKKSLSQTEIEGIVQQIIKGIIRELANPKLAKDLSKIVPTLPDANDHTFYLSSSWFDTVIAKIKIYPLNDPDKYVQNVTKCAVDYFVSASKQIAKKRENHEENEAELDSKSSSLTP